MKKLIMLVCLLLCLSVHGAGFSMVVGNGSLTIAPVRSSATAVPWAAGKNYKQGMIVKYGSAFYMLEKAVASSSTTPDRDSVNYRNLYSNKARDSVVVRNFGPDIVWVDVGVAAVLGKGIYLEEGDVLSIVGVQASVHCISEGSSTVTGVDVVSD